MKVGIILCLIGGAVGLLIYIFTIGDKTLALDDVVSWLLGAAIAFGIVKLWKFIRGKSK